MPNCYKSKDYQFIKTCPIFQMVCRNGHQAHRFNVNKKVCTACPTNRHSLRVTCIICGNLDDSLCTRSKHHSCQAGGYQITYQKGQPLGLKNLTTGSEFHVEAYHNLAQQPTTGLSFNVLGEETTLLTLNNQALHFGRNLTSNKRKELSSGSESTDESSDDSSDESPLPPVRTLLTNRSIKRAKLVPGSDVSLAQQLEVVSLAFSQGPAGLHNRLTIKPKTSLGCQDVTNQFIAKFSCRLVLLDQADLDTVRLPTNCEIRQAFYLDNRINLDIIMPSLLNQVVGPRIIRTGLLVFLQGEQGFQLEGLVKYNYVLA